MVPMLVVSTQPVPALAGAQSSPSPASEEVPVTLLPSTSVPDVPLDPHIAAVPAATTNSTDQAAASAVPLLPSSQAAPARQMVTFNEVRDEIVEEEVKLFATGVFENCPDETLSDDYFESRKKFIFSEKHLEENISCVKFAHLSTRQLREAFH